MSDTTPLLGRDDPAVFDVERPEGTSPFLLIADHAGRHIPRQLGQLGLTPADLQRHIAWDIGIAGLAGQMAARMDACLIRQNYSRLVIDCNRPLLARDSIAALSENTAIPGNQNLTPSEGSVRAHAIFHPYHNRIRQELLARKQAGRVTILISLHSFTPVYQGVNRLWHAGVLYHRDTRLALPLLDLLRREPGLVIGDNEPYAVSDASDYSIPVHGERNGLPHVELEIRQDLISTAAGQRAWADRLIRLLPLAAEIALSQNA
ncbi:MAG TPA: N-formylglutamate amidohydrolase [Fluviicoccus sp.]|nr:N-formylglutamate amidohydrolase [Fluviicoccus sp.]